MASAAGCSDAIAPAAVPRSGPCADASILFDPSTTGVISGQVVWAEDDPAPMPFKHRLNVAVEDAATEARLRSNRLVPLIDASSRGVRDAVVTLRGMDVRRARPWDHPTVHVEFSDLQLRVRQGASEERVGFVRRGESIAMVSREPRFHVLQARGTDWFTLAFADPDLPLRRVLDLAGVIELRSGAGYAWMRAFLLVDDHPYATRTDVEGRFTLDRVPPGHYAVVCWMPCWEEREHDRDPDTGFVTRVRYGSPATVSQAVELAATQLCDVRLVVGPDAFSSTRGDGK
jgi:hypothetical protein